MTHYFEDLPESLPRPVRRIARSLKNAIFEGKNRLQTNEYAREQLLI